MAKHSSEQPAWETLDRREIYHAPPFLALSVERVLLPDGRVVEDFHRIEKPDYALVVPRLADGRTLLLRQYKHGVGEVALKVEILRHLIELIHDDHETPVGINQLGRRRQPDEG